MSRSEHGRETPNESAGQPLRTVTPSLKATGLAIAWIGGVGCGWRVCQQSNLLDAVLRGAGTWVALMVLWLAALAFCQRYVLSSDGPMSETSGAGTGLNQPDMQAES